MGPEEFEVFKRDFDALNKRLESDLFFRMLLFCSALFNDYIRIHRKRFPEIPLIEAERRVEKFLGCPRAEWVRQEAARRTVKTLATLGQVGKSAKKASGFTLQ